MTTIQSYYLPQLHQLPATLPDDGAISIILEEGIPLFRASTAVQKRIEGLLHKQQGKGLTPAEAEELDRYETIDDYLSHLNRIVRNLLQPPTS